VGTWGAGILDDDLARDVHDRYLGAHGAGSAPDAIVPAILEAFAAAAADADEGPIVWLAIAHAQRQCGHRDPAVIARVQEIVAGGLGLARWKEAGRDQLARRRSVLTRFVGTLVRPAKPKPVPRPAATVPFTVGDCLAIDLGDGRYGGAVVTKYSPGASSSHILSVLDFLAPSPPEPAVFAPPSWLRATDRPPLTIVKYCVYADGYRRHGGKYRVVSHIELDEIPPPLTLGLANWGNVWRDLGKRLGDPRPDGSVSREE
jgi:hypothetical protein